MRKPIVTGTSQRVGTYLNIAATVVAGTSSGIMLIIWDQQRVETHSAFLFSFFNVATLSLSSRYNADYMGPTLC